MAARSDSTARLSVILAGSPALPFSARPSTLTLAAFFRVGRTAATVLLFALVSWCHVNVVSAVPWTIRISEAYTFADWSNPDCLEGCRALPNGCRCSSLFRARNIANSEATILLDSDLHSPDFQEDRFLLPAAINGNGHTVWCNENDGTAGKGVYVYRTDAGTAFAMSHVTIKNCSQTALYIATHGPVSLVDVTIDSCKRGDALCCMRRKSR